MIILDRLPIPEQDTPIEGPDGSSFLGPDGRPLVAKRYQVFAWVTLSAKDELGWEPGRACFPAILDTGLNHNFSITREHWDSWAGIKLVPIGSSIEFGEQLTFPKEGQVWIHPNEPGTSRRSGQVPIRLRVPDGIIVFPTTTTSPARLPTLGLRALARNRLIVIVNGFLQEVTMSQVDVVSSREAREG